MSAEHAERREYDGPDVCNCGLVDPGPEHSAHYPMLCRERSPRPAVLWVNDTPDRYAGNDGGQAHGHIYQAGKRHVVAVTIEAENGTCVQVNFDPRDGSFTSQDITPASDKEESSA